MNTNRPARILVVDDEPINVRLLSEILGDGHDVFFATNGPTALEMAVAEQPDLILLDVMMPGMDGYEACRRLKADPLTRGIAVVFVTGKTDAEAEQLGRALGAVDYLHKPLDPQQVVRTVETQLRRSRAPRAQTHHAQSNPERPAPMKPKEPIQILVVDDEMAVVKLLIDIFEEENEILFASEGLKALEIAASVRPDLILLDVMMPDMDGLEVCRRLKAHAQTRDIPVIFITAHLDPAREIDGLNAGAVDYINKPINAALVRARVTTHLRLLQARREQRAFNDALEHLVATRTAELKAAMESLHRTHEELAASEARATLSTLIASVSHELATPLANSAMTSDILSSQSDKLLADVESGQLKRSSLATFLSDLRQGTDLLQRNLTRARDLLGNFKQVAVDQASESRRTFDLSVAVHEVIATMTPTLKLQPHRVVIQAAPGVVMDSYPGPLGQVIINLVNNAYLHAFTDQGGGVVTLRAGSDGDWAWLHCEDNGAGIPPQNLARIFEPFFTTRPGSGGSGLGMLIVRNLVAKSLGGTLDVESRVGVGTTVRIRMPMVAPVPPPKP